MINRESDVSDTSCESIHIQQWSKYQSVAPSYDFAREQKVWVVVPLHNQKFARKVSL